MPNGEGRVYRSHYLVQNHYQTFALCGAKSPTISLNPRRPFTGWCAKCQKGLDKRPELMVAARLLGAM